MTVRLFLHSFTTTLVILSVASGFIEALVARV